MAGNKPIMYGGKRATVTWHGDLCIHIGECGRAKGELFVGGRQPWCQPDLTDDDDVQAVVERCPTGALSTQFSDGSHTETPATENTVQVAYNGPLFFRGDLNIADVPADVPGLKFRAAICRCGQSKNKPYCDNSHEDAGFRDYGAIGETGDSTTASTGPLEVQLAEDGPLLLKGGVTLISGSGRSSWRGDQVALCRCGASENKPFCDGQHRKIGFKSA
jgi:CDGSH-type Zn-finger protein/uncharacterized Fe-S cluster protein YjdI